MGLGSAATEWQNNKYYYYIKNVQISKHRLINFRKWGAEGFTTMYIPHNVDLPSLELVLKY